ncbi:hypothetical protein ACP70R_041884 [Stipagrostis hirtigluma subsp. patula]
MASSNAGQQQEAPEWRKDGLLDCSFASYLELRKDRNRRPPVLMHSSLLKTFRCSHCKQREDLLRPASSATPEPNAREHAVPFPDAEQVSKAAALLHELALERRSCFRCAEEICKKTRYLQDAMPAAIGGDTPLHIAVRSGSLRMVCHLLTLVGGVGGHDRAVQAVRKPNKRGETALYAAVSVGDIDIVKLLMWVDPHLGQIPCRDTSPVYLAVSLGRMDIAEALHDAPGAILSYSGPDGQNALHAAALQGGGITYKLLTWNKDLIQKKDNNGSTPIHFAVSVVQSACIHVPLVKKNSHIPRVKDVSTIRNLLDADSSMAYEPDGEGLFPLHIAAMTGQQAVVDILLTRCPGCIGLRDKQGRTFIHVAAQNKAFDVVSYISFGQNKLAAILNIQDDNGNTALHLAVEASNVMVVSALLMNRRVCLNLMNNKGQTAQGLFVSKGKIFAIRESCYLRDPDNIIYNMLIILGAKHGSCRWDHIQENCTSHCIPKPGDKDNKQEVRAHVFDEKEESEKLTSSTQTLGIGAVLIATVTFGATFALPGGNIADDHPHGGTPTLAGRWYFDAYIVANTLAFICSSVATLGLMYSGMAMVTLPVRRLHFFISLFFATSSVTSLTTAFALGVYLLLAPVARPTAILICSISPLVLIYKNAQVLRDHVVGSFPVFCRRGFWVWLMSTVRFILIRMLMELWPFAVIFGWAAHLRDRRND